MNYPLEDTVELSQLSLTANQLAVERVMTKMFTRYHCDVMIAIALLLPSCGEWAELYNPRGKR